jgi:hemolysin III
MLKHRPMALSSDGCEAAGVSTVAPLPARAPVELAPWMRWLGTPDFDEQGIPRYRRWELQADGVVHAATAVWVCWSCSTLLRVSVQAYALVYVACTVFLCATSAAFNILACGWSYWPHLLRQLDHAAIFLYIAGCYTALASEPTLLCAVWTVCVMGALSKLAFGRRVEVAGMLAYFVLGLAPLVIMPRGSALRRQLTSCLMCYLVGATFYVNNALRGSMAIWHMFVLAGSVVMWRMVFDEVQCRAMHGKPCAF